MIVDLCESDIYARKYWRGNTHAVDVFFFERWEIFLIFYASKSIRKTEFTQKSSFYKLFLFYSFLLFISSFNYLNPGFSSSFFLVVFRASIKIVLWQMRFLMRLSAWCDVVYTCLCFSSPTLRKIFLIDCFSHLREFLDTANSKEGGLMTNWEKQKISRRDQTLKMNF